VTGGIPTPTRRLYNVQNSPETDGSGYWTMVAGSFIATAASHTVTATLIYSADKGPWAPPNNKTLADITIRVREMLPLAEHRPVSAYLGGMEIRTYSMQGDVGSSPVQPLETALEDWLGEDIGIGRGALARAVTHYGAVAIGSFALAHLRDSENTAVGLFAMPYLEDGWYNVGLGEGVGRNLVRGLSNVLVGSYAGDHMVEVDQNTCVGDSAGAFVEDGDNNTFIGACVGGWGTTQATTVSGSVAIGIDSAGTPAQTNADNEFVLGTPLHTVRVKGYLQLDRSQTTVGAAGAASALPATPEKYLTVKDSNGVEFVIPCYAKS